VIRSHHKPRNFAGGPVGVLDLMDLMDLVDLVG
jgi:hypothetical protein